METTRDQKLQELNELRQRVAALERDVETPPHHWQAREFYSAYFATTGFVLGMFAAMASLLFNVVGSLLVGQHPLRLIQVYLTFPLGERALTPNFDTGVALALGCIAYMTTGAFLGIPFQLGLARFSKTDSLVSRLIWASVFGLVVWVVNFYVLLSWLQPLLFGGNWIVELIPWWVAALTHLVFGWTMALAYPLGAYTPYRRQTEQV
jgi:hypothetical protein